MRETLNPTIELTPITGDDTGTGNSQRNQSDVRHFNSRLRQSLFRPRWYRQSDYEVLEPQIGSTSKSIRQSKWKSIAKTVSLHLTTLGAVILVMIALFWVAWTKNFGGLYKYSSIGGCTPEGRFLSRIDTRYNIWGRSKFFEITLGFGAYPFSTVKLIDIAWDTIIGRGGTTIQLKHSCSCISLT